MRVYEDAADFDVGFFFGLGWVLRVWKRRRSAELSRGEGGGCRDAQMSLGHLSLSGMSW